MCGGPTADKWCEQYFGKMDKNEYPLFVINAFTKGPFSGNPAAVCLVKKTQVRESFTNKVYIKMKTKNDEKLGHLEY